MPVLLQSTINNSPPGVTVLNETLVYEDIKQYQSNRVYFVAPCWSAPKYFEPIDVFSFAEFLELFTLDGSSTLHRVHTTALHALAFFKCGGKVLSVVPIPLTASQKTLFTTTSVGAYGFTPFTRLIGDSAVATVLNSTNSSIFQFNNHYSTATADRLFPNTVAGWDTALGGALSNEPGVIILPLVFASGIADPNIGVLTSFLDFLKTSGVLHIVFLDVPLPQLYFHRMVSAKALFAPAAAEETALTYSKISNYGTTATWNNTAAISQNDSASLTNVANFATYIAGAIGEFGDRIAFFYDWLHESEPDYQKLTSPQTPTLTTLQPPLTYYSGGDIYNVGTIPPSAYAAAKHNLLANAGIPFGAPGSLNPDVFYFEPIELYLYPNQTSYLNCVLAGINFFEPTIAAVRARMYQFSIDANGVIGVSAGLWALFRATRSVKNQGVLKYIHAKHSFNFLVFLCVKALQRYAFRLLSPTTLTLSTLQGVLTTVASRIYNLGGLHGETLESSFYAKIDATNNPPDLIEQGVVIIEFYAVFPGMVEKLLIELVRVNIGGINQQSSDTSAADIIG